MGMSFPGLATNDDEGWLPWSPPDGGSDGGGGGSGGGCGCRASFSRSKIRFFDGLSLPASDGDDPFLLIPAENRSKRKNRIYIAKFTWN